jgi:hypothetical protein
MRNFTTTMLVGVVCIVAVLMIGSTVMFLVKPDPTIKAGPMYVTLGLTTMSVIVMAFLAVNAAYPMITRQQRVNLSLVMWSMGATGVVTGLLTLGGAVSSIVMRLFVATLAFMFISLQRSRLERARATGVVPGMPWSRPAGGTQSGQKTRQRRGGRKN